MSEASTESVPAVQEGAVKFFSNEKGFGFITSQTGEDIFVHYSGIVTEGYRTLAQGEHVEFEIAESPRGPKAVNVRSLEVVIVTPPAVKAVKKPVTFKRMAEPK